jgi:structural maintenance of chromosome 1
VFASFCQQINVSNIREFEERQLKAAQEESEARRRFDKQIARLTHAYARNLVVPFDSIDPAFFRSKWQEDQLKTVHDRRSTLHTLVKAETVNLEKLTGQKSTVEQEIAEAESEIADLQEELKELQETLDERTKVVEQVKRTTTKASKVLDQALKEIASKVGCHHNRLGFSLIFSQNDEIERLASERSSIYRKCRLDGIKLPLLEGNLRNVSMEEVMRCRKIKTPFFRSITCRIFVKKLPWTWTKTKTGLSVRKKCKTSGSRLILKV